jgi:predicted component of type VI protein secretion system
MQVVLVMFRADGQRRSFSIVREMTVVGRREDCDLRIPLGEVSRKHCRILKDDDGVRVEDLGSSNGTFHNEERVQAAQLSAGDTVRVGPVTFMVQIDGVPADEDMQPASAPDAAAQADQSDQTDSAAAPPAEQGNENADADDLAVFLAGDSAAGDKPQTSSSEDSHVPQAGGSIFDLQEEPSSKKRPA